ncbi:15488_t:CDS:2, partial [Acaulospora colombiana]
EIPLLEKDYERQRKADKAYHEAARKLQLETAAAKHAEDLKLKERLKRILPDYLKNRSEVESRRFEEFEGRRRAAQAKIEEEKEKRRQIYRAKKEEETKRREAEEDARLRAEEEERRITEESQRIEEERRAKEAADKFEYEERKRKLDEQAARQREAERSAEERRSARERAQEKERLEREEQERIDRRRRESERTPSSGTGYVPPALRSREESSWRRDDRRKPAVGRANVSEDTSRRYTPARRETDDMWRRPSFNRNNTNEETEKRRPEVSRRVTSEEGEWRRGSSTSARDELEWRRGGQWRSSKDEDLEQNSSTSSKGPTRTAKADNVWKPRIRQSLESSTMDKTTSGRESWTSTLRDMEGDSYVSDPEQEGFGDKLSTSDSSKQHLPSEKQSQLPTDEINDDGFTVVKGRRRKNQFSGTSEAE